MDDVESGSCTSVPKIIMVGTPNLGSFLILQMLMGRADMQAKLDVLRRSHGPERHESKPARPSRAENSYLGVFRSFASLYQMLPAPSLGKWAERLYEASCYGGGDGSPPRRYLERGLEFHEIQQAFLKQRKEFFKKSAYTISGVGFQTITGLIEQPDRGVLDISRANCQIEDNGDYSISAEMATLPDLGASQYFIDEEHGGLTARAEILRAIDDLLRFGKTEQLYSDSVEPVAAARRALRPSVSGQGSRNAARTVDDTAAQGAPEILHGAEHDAIDGKTVNEGKSRFQTLAHERDDQLNEEIEALEGLDAQCRVRDTESLKTIRRTPQMRQVEDLITRDLLGARAERRRSIATQPTYNSAYPVVIRVKKMGVGEALSVRLAVPPGELPIDAISIGHYWGETPHGAERDLDRAISRRILAENADGTDAVSLSDTDLLLTRFTERNVIRGELGQLFFLSLPSSSRDRARDRIEEGVSQVQVRSSGDQTVVVVGMGLPGRFGEPELAVLARELSWSLDRMGKRHLATAPIGTRNSNLEPEQAIAAWLLGIKLGLSASSGESTNRVRQVTYFVDDNSYERIAEVFREQIQLQNAEDRHSVIEGRHFFEFRSEGAPVEADGESHQATNLVTPQRSPCVGLTDAASGLLTKAATRVTFTYSHERRRYKFGAITENAAVPEQEIRVTPSQIKKINDRLVSESDRSEQAECGLQLGINLVPRELREHMTGDAPLVMLLDADSSRIHWEMVAQPDPINLNQPHVGWRSGDDGPGVWRFFVGTHRGLTRQLESTFLAPPECLPASPNRLRVLIVADPAEESALSLPWARKEGALVAELFRRFNDLNRGLRTAGGSSIPERPDFTCEVLELLGPAAAESDLVLRELTLGHYDVFHFAGHCQYIEGKPDKTGWVFGQGNIITANELAPIDRIPKFIFSNACETGKIPETRSRGLAPSFAESFFARGVANFVCTAWPVADRMAHLFAKTLYESLLGLRPDTPDDDQPSRTSNVETSLEDGKVMHVAMRAARRAVFNEAGGARTWGAYQHYGNPYYRFFPRKVPDGGGTA
jgi:CHAT domain